MPGRPTQYEELARQMAERLEGDREAVRQLSLLPDEVDGAQMVDQGEGDGTGKRGKGKALNQLREFLAVKGYRMPEDVLAEIAGLTSGQDAIATAMAQAERILAWAEAGATSVKGAPKVQTLPQRLATFQQVLVAQLRAADALMPYGAPKATPDVTVQQAVHVHVPAAPSRDQGRAMRDVSPRSDVRMLPADLRHEMQQKQDVSKAGQPGSDGDTRTKGPSR
ncbi:hypothetical protein [Oceaniglobus trochenteri]|uniref:hypothetical protein n=1 Tax=Oceaniglobus trochenteri TaxID=2763260 RepID=UPI001CFFDD72|nr:hypothetical protein [Oceaniglobus trochenteri]